MPSAPPVIDVKELIARYSIEELNEAAEEYFARLQDWDRHLAKPFSSATDAIHLLVQLSYMLQGLELYPGMRVLDFGCGPGWASRMLNQMGFEVISLDVSATALKMGAELARRHPVFGEQPPHHFLRFDGRHIELADASVDRIFCFDALHHVPDQHLVLGEMSRVLKTGGIAGFVEPGPAHSKHPSSQLEMRNFKVIENDIVLDDVFAIARSVGFTDIELTIGTIHPPRVSLERFKRFPGDRWFASAFRFLRATAERVHNYPIFFLHKGKAEIDDSREMSGLCTRIATAASIRAARGSRVILQATFDNVSGKRWLASGAKPGSVNIGYFVHRLGEDGGLVTGTEFRSHLSSDVVEPGACVATTIDLGVLDPGRYRVDIDLVSEHVRWFQANGSAIASVDVSVD
jgi:SAM-dependent methyltransferase